MKKFKFDKNSKIEFLFSDINNICDFKTNPISCSISNPIDEYIKLGIEKGIIKEMIYIPIKDKKTNEIKYFKIKKNGTIHKQILAHSDDNILILKND